MLSKPPSNGGSVVPEIVSNFLENYQKRSSNLKTSGSNYSLEDSSNSPYRLKDGNNSKSATRILINLRGQKYWMTLESVDSKDSTSG